MARTIKPASELSKKRVIEKFEIERRFWTNRGVHWAIVTEHEIDLVLSKNVEWTHPYRAISALQPLTKQTVQTVAKTLTQMLTENVYPLSDTALSCDDRLGLESGSSLAVARHLIANRLWQVDLTQPIHPNNRLILVNTYDTPSHKKASGQ